MGARSKLTIGTCLAVTLFASAAALAEKSSSPLLLERVGDLDAKSISVEVLVEASEKKFNLDTGSAATEVEPDDNTKMYPAIRSFNKSGPSGSKVRCDWISIPLLTSGGLAKRDVGAGRCALDGGLNNLGINFFDNSVVTLDFQKLQLRVSEQRPKNKQSFYPLRRTSSGAHGLIELPVTIGHTAMMAMFDTGTAITAVDSNFILANPALFEAISSNGVANDITGKDFDVSVYKMKTIEVGSLKLNNIYVAAFDFKGLRQSLGEDCPIILGNNVILKANWILDLMENQWLVEPMKNE